MTEDREPKRPKLSHPLVTAQHLQRSVIVYMRQSSPGQVRDNWGSTALQQDLGQLALDYGWRPDQSIVISEDLGRSGSTAVGRTGWEEMLRLIATGNVGAVIALNVSRWARQMMDFEELRTLAKYNGTILIFDGRPINPADPIDTAMAQQQASYAQMENDKRAQHLRDSRRKKALAGARVSKLSIGYIRGADGEEIFDPEVKPALDEMRDIFQRIRSYRGTVAELNRLGRKLPGGSPGKINWTRPTQEMVRRFLTSLTHAGCLVYGMSDTRPEYGLDPQKKPRRRKLPESEWIIKEGHHPAYFNLAERARFLEYARANAFHKHNRPNKGAALCQGLLRCATCGGALTVNYVQRGCDRYQCTTRAATYAEMPCFSIAGRDFDAAIGRDFLRRLGNPLADVFQSAIGELRVTEKTRVGRMDAERRRLEYAERKARDWYEQVDPRNRLVAADREAKYEVALAARQAFEQQVGMEPAGPAVDALEQEFQALHGSIQDIAVLWHHPVVTHRDRQTMLQCLIDCIVVQRTATAIEATIHWVDGSTSQVKVWRLDGVRELVRQLHAEDLTAKQICECLAAGDPATGQSWKYTVTHIFQILKKLGLTPNSPRMAMKKIREEIDALYDRGLRVPAIVKYLEDRGYRTPRKCRWTPGTVQHWLSRQNRRDAFEQLHRELLADAKSRGLTNAQTAEEFNRRQIPRAGGEPWNADTVRQRRSHLHRRWRRRGRETGNGAEADQGA